MTDNLKAILKRENLEFLLDFFLSQGVTDSILQDFTDLDLRELGVTKIGERMRLLSAFKLEASESPHIKTSFFSNQTPLRKSSLIHVKGGLLPESSSILVRKIHPFEISRHAVTLEKWKTVHNWAISNEFEIELGASVGFNYPVTLISWYDVLKWCNAQSLMEGLEPVYQVQGQSGFYMRGEFGAENSNKISFNPKASGYRLPTEGEWEWAARGGINAQDSIYSGSDQLEEVGWFSVNSQWQLHPVGEKKPNELGLYDMSGNVWEWCWDASCSGRRIRGGCWKYDAEVCSVTFRRIYFPNYRSNRVGFRLARSL
jgi:formylglycine-generating enzyme required for sulfatase activity